MYLPAIEAYVPQAVLRTFRAFFEFCYIARHDIITESTLSQLEDALERFHKYCAIFEDIGIRPDGFALPRQHSLIHYLMLIRAFGAPNGVCSSLTESKHITAVKKPWRRSSRYEALGQMLLINQRLDKLAASYVDFANRGMLDGTCLSEALKVIGEPYCLQKFHYYNTATIEHLCTGDSDSEDGSDDDEDGGAADGPTLLAHVELAKTIRMSITFTC